MTPPAHARAFGLKTKAAMNYRRFHPLAALQSSYKPFTPAWQFHRFGQAD
jgi:hypothetical protein